MFNSIVDRYTDIGCKIYDEMSWTQNHNIKTDVATNCKHKSLPFNMTDNMGNIILYHLKQER